MNNENIFFWLDILGFSALVENEKEYAKLAELLKKFSSLFVNIDLLESKIISDGILLYFKEPKFGLNVEIFQKTCEKIAKKQRNFILKNNEFIRGGIAVGTIYEEKNSSNFISNGLARAHRIESNAITWPVIGTNKVQMDKIKSLLNIHDDGDLGFRKSRNFNGEDIFYINIFDDFDTSNQLENILLRKKREYYSKSPKVWVKYEWLYQEFKNFYGEGGEI